MSLLVAMENEAASNKTPKSISPTIQKPQAEFFKTPVATATKEIIVADISQYLKNFCISPACKLTG